MRKIKSVKLAKEFNNGVIEAGINTLVIFFQKQDRYYIDDTGFDYPFTENQIRENKTRLFDIEYEPEGFEFSHFPFYANDSCNKQLIEKELNRLADWCDGQSEKDLPREYFVEYDDISLLTDWTHDQYFRHGLKFNSKQSAELFISELNKPENSDYKKYFIELLKKTRL